MLTIIQKVIKKETEPKVYAIVIESEIASGVLMVVDYCLEDAARQAREIAGAKFQRHPESFRMVNYSSMTISDLKNSIFKMEISDLKPDTAEKGNKVVTNTNMLMRKIIENKDVKLFDRIKGRLSESERLYIQEKLSLSK